MRRLRYSVIAGATTLLGGIYFREKYTTKSYVVSSGKSIQPLGRSVIVEEKENKPFDSVRKTNDHKSRLFRFGQPKPGSLCIREGYGGYYDHKNKIPLYVVEHLSASNRQFDHGSYHGKREYAEDSSVPELFRSTNSDYKCSRYEKGHMARADNHRQNEKSWRDTYYFTNIAPQIPEFNKGIWRRLEQYVKHFVKSYENVYVYSGALFIPKKDSDGKLQVSYEVIGENVGVPTHFYKVILGETEDGKFDMESYVIEHTKHNAVKENLKAFLVDKSYIEEHAGYLICDTLPTSKFRKVNFKRIKTEETNVLQPTL